MAVHLYIPIYEDGEWESIICSWMLIALNFLRKLCFQSTVYKTSSKQPLRSWDNVWTLPLCKNTFVFTLHKEIGLQELDDRLTDSVKTVELNKKIKSMSIFTLTFFSRVGSKLIYFSWVFDQYVFLWKVFLFPISSTIIKFFDEKFSVYSKSSGTAQAKVTRKPKLISEH